MHGYLHTHTQKKKKQKKRKEKKYKKGAAKLISPIDREFLGLPLQVGSRSDGGSSASWCKIFAARGAGYGGNSGLAWVLHA